MKIKFGFFAALVLFVLANATVSFGQDDQIAGGYGDADVADAEVISAAKFAAQKWGKKHAAVIGVATINKARVQVVAGLNYEICMEVAYRPKSSKRSVKRFVKTVVYKNLKNKYSLTSWVIAKTPPDC